MTVKVRKVGNSRVLTVPKNVKLNRHVIYDVFKGEDGALIYLPHRKNPFKDPKYIKNHLYNGNNKGFINMEDGHENQ